MVCNRYLKNLFYLHAFPLGSANNSRTSQEVSPRKDFELVVQPEVQTIEESTSSSSTESRTGQISVSMTKCADKCTNACSEVIQVDRSAGSSEPSVTVTCNRSMTSKNSLQVSSSSDDTDSIEAMLRSIGMEWAIPTLHKTKEALALTSSSSSLELKRNGSSNSGSEVSLKQFLNKQVKVSSSTLRSDASPVSFSGEISELSSIQGNISILEKSNQRTSTPVISSKSTERSGKRVVFSEASDISSVRDENGKKSSKVSYHSLSDTNSDTQL